MRLLHLSYIEPDGPTKMINSLSAISRLKSFTASKPFGYLFVMCCKDKLAIFESSLNEHHAFYYEFCICISLTYGTSIPFLPAFDHATITQTFLRQIGNSAFGFSRTVLFCPLCTNKMFTLIQNDETKSLYSLHCIFLKNSLYFSMMSASRNVNRRHT